MTKRKRSKIEDARRITLGMDTDATDESYARLRGFLGGGATSSVPGDIGSGVELSSAALDTVPNLPSCRRGSLGTELAVDPRLEGGKRVLDVRALAEAGADEDGIEGKQDPAAALKENGGEEKADPQGDLEAGDDGHGHVIVLLDEGANGVGDPVVLGLGLSAIGGRDLGGGYDGGDDGGAGVSREVEDGVDGVGEQGEVVGGGEEPHEGHDCMTRVGWLAA